MLHQKRVVEEAVWSNPQIEKFRAEDDDPGLAVTLFDLVKTFQGVLERAKNRPMYEITNEDVSVPDMIRYLHNVFEEREARDSVSARELFERQTQPPRDDLPVSGDAGAGEAAGHRPGAAGRFGEIGLKRLKGFETAFASGEEMAAIDEGYN